MPPGPAGSGDDLVAGRYRILGEIARGASATLYRAEDTVLGRVVALKAIAPALAADSSFVERFTREARTAAGLDHPHIVTVHDTGVMDDGRPFISMKLVEGLPLDEFVSVADLDARERIALLVPIAEALDYIHSQGLVHRDVKPGNILVDAQGRASLTDFGIAVPVRGDGEPRGMTAGTPRYMAPEQVRGQEPTPASDSYSLGVIAYELLAGAPPFTASGRELLHQVLNEAPRSLRRAAPDVTREVETTVLAALAKEAAERPNSASGFVAALLEAIPALPPPPVSSEPAAQDGEGGFNGRIIVGGVAGVFASLALMTAAFFFLNGDDPGEALVDETPIADITATRTLSPTQTPTPRPTPTQTPTFNWAEITSITESNATGTYNVHFRVGNFVPDIEATHVHFFFDTVPPELAGIPGPGDWILYDGPSPFTGYSIAEGQGASQMCILVANADHTVNQDTGNCVELP